MFAATAVMALRGVTGSTMYDLLGSLSVFGFLTAYALVALALPFARRALGQHSHLLAALSVLTVAVILIIAIFDLNSAADAVHARIPYIYLAYIAVGLAWYGLRRRKCLRRVMSCGKAVPNPVFRSEIPYVNFMPRQLIFS